MQVKYLVVTEDEFETLKGVPGLYKSSVLYE
jgi:hypothetical protein